MHIREIVLDGFKSYQTRTVIGPFDSHFSAITGLNGSGKSNILDAICFVLGITTLANVRVNNLQELIYRNGQAGVTKANVTLFFDNADKTRCPGEYQKCDEISVRREISLGGETKYSINGTRATGERVKGFFQSVGLNVNNPNFLIMQGRITQVIHMKPDELLSLVSETSGINTYETGKTKAIKKLAKKQNSLRDIQTYFDRDLEPKLEKARREKEEYDSWAREKDGLDAFEHRILCKQYRDLLMEDQRLPELLREMRNRLKALEQDQQRLDSSMAQLAKERDQLAKKKDGNSEKTRADEDAVQALKKGLAEKKTRLKGLQSEIKATLSELKTIEAEIAECRSKRLQSAQEAKAAEIIEQAMSEKQKTLNDEAMDLQMKIAAAKSGTVVDPVRELENRKNLKQQEADRRNHELQQVLQQLDQCAADIRKKEDALNRNKAQSRDQESIEDLRRSIQALEDQLETSRGSGDNVDMGARATKEHELRNEEQELVRLGQKFTLNYRDPEPQFDRSKVKGRVIRLIKLKDTKYARALEAGGGGLLFSVIVDTDLTAQVLLSKKSLGTVRYLPLNRMQPHPISAQKVEQARREFGDRVSHAMNLIEFDQALSKGIEYVFGTFFVCMDKESAKQIAYGPYRERAVTIEGDQYDPHGTVTGGYYAPTESDMDKVGQIAEKEKRIENLKRELNSYEEKMRRASVARNETMKLQAELETKKRQLATREELQNTSLSARLENDIVELRQKQATLKLKQETLTEQVGELQEEIRELEKERRDSKGRRGSLQSEFQSKFARVQEKLEEVTKRLREAKGVKKNKEAEMESMQTEISDKEQKLITEKEKHAKMTHDIETVSAECELAAGNLEQKQREIDEKKKRDSAFSKEIMELEGRCSEAGKQKEQLQIEKRGIEGQVQEKEKSHIDTKAMMKAMKSKYPFVEGSPFTDAEIDSIDVDAAVRELHEKRTDLERRGTKVNKRVGGTLEDLKKDYEKVAQDKAVVERDSQEIEKVIKNLDEQKERDLEKACIAVDENLKEIFSSLLPGAEANLVRAEERKREGLEFRVKFSGVVKSNLNELSGGQRSLLALSFMLALLKCKPAPIYIFDEIDAALDLNHTQNIGSMVRRHFAESQFVVVSLKEGMFSNANILFRTQFVDGRSTVERHELASREKESRSRTGHK